MIALELSDILRLPSIMTNKNKQTTHKPVSHSPHQQPAKRKKKRKMIVLRANIIHLRFIGMYLRKNQERVTHFDIAFGVIVGIPLLLTTGSAALYFLLKGDNILDATNALYVMCAFFMYISIFWIFAMQKPRIRDIFEELQRIVDKRECMTKKI